MKSLITLSSKRRDAIQAAYLLTFLCFLQSSDAFSFVGYYYYQSVNKYVLCKCSIGCNPHGYWVFKNLLLSKEWLCDVFILLLPPHKQISEKRS
nr:MAG TPA: hypothetical protein [Caudoviricetes sp.]